MKIVAAKTELHDAPVVSAMLGIGVLLAVPATLYVVFSLWSDSLQRQIVAAAGLALLTLFTVLKRKLNALLLSLVFVTQCSISLHSIPLAPPAIFQFFFIDVLIVLLVMTAVERHETFRPDLAGWLLLTMALWELFATIFSAHVDRSLLFVMWQLKYFVIYVLVRNLRISDELLARLQYVVAAVLIIQSLLAFVQQLKGGPIGLNVLGEQDASRLFFVRGDLRVSGTLGATNGFGGYLAAMLCFLIPSVLTKRNVVIYAAVGVGTMALLFTFSRAGWLSLIIGAGISVLVMTRSRVLTWGRMVLLTFAGFLLLSVAIGAYYEKVIERFENKEAVGAAVGRFSQFYQAWPVISRYPIVGIGPGVTEYYGAWNENEKYIRQKLPDVRFGNQMHSAQLQYWIESGTPGFALFMLLIVITGVTAFRRRASNDASELMKLSSIGAGAAALAILIHSSFGPEINNYRILICFVTFLALARNLSSAKINAESTAAKIPHPPANFL
ncbi:MAG: O-antigen ligase family protein [Gammaproteobacteria bacterium]|nr:O-antigen ligase family protein [Gammaproteobacteria bacterium]